MSDAGDYLVAFLERSALDGHTVLPIGVAGAVLLSRSLRLEDALRDVGPDGRPRVAVPTAELLGLRRLVDAERKVAEDVRTRAGAGTVTIVSGPSGDSRDQLVGSLGGAQPAVLDDAERLDAETFAAFFTSCADGEDVVLAGDVDEIGSAGPGRLFADVLASRLVQTRIPTFATAESALPRLIGSVRDGRWAPAPDADRQVVAMDVTSTAEAAHRVGQLIETSIPRALGIAAADVQVLVVLERDVAALTGVAEAAGAPPPRTVLSAVGLSYQAVVLVLSPQSSGVLTRSVVYSGARRAQAHLSIVNATGSALADAVASGPGRRRTLLPQLLT